MINLWVDIELPIEWYCYFESLPNGMFSYLLHGHHQWVGVLWGNVGDVIVPNLGG